jgi:hypothetical protein
VAGYGDKTTPKSVKLARDFGDGVEGGSSLSEKCWDSPPETLRAGDAWPMIIQRSTSCTRYDSRLLEIVRSLKPRKFLPIADEKTAIVRVMAASINPSDVTNVVGAMSQTKAPHIPGRDFASLVQAGPSEWIGTEV